MYIVNLQAHGAKTKAGRKNLGGRHHYQGKECLDVHLLKQARAWAKLASEEGDCQVVGAQASAGQWVTYKYREAHPILRWLPSKLAEWIGDNYGPTLGIPPKRHAAGWTVGELNDILDNNLVPGTKGHLRTFGCIQWECELFSGRQMARCYPFDLPNHRFRGCNPQVSVCIPILRRLLTDYTMYSEGLCLLDRTVPIQSEPTRSIMIRSGYGFRHEWEQSSIVR